MKNKYTKMSRVLPKAQTGIDDWVQRAANANLNFWEICRLASSADNGKGGFVQQGDAPKQKMYASPYEELADIKGGFFDKEQIKNIKRTLPQGVSMDDWVAFNREAGRMNVKLSNPDYAKYTDSTGMLKPEWQSVATNFDPYYLYYRPAFANKTSVTADDIMKLYQSQPGGISNFKLLVNNGYRMPKRQMGGPIVDPRGQWAHPGKITRIPSSNITMQGVPYPVLGVGNNGKKQMMYPGMDYNFGGASYVDEYPMMQLGGGLLSRSVTCSSCGHSWKSTDGGADALMCHKCGGMVKMKNGGQTKNERDMVNGIADILSQVKDSNNRAQIAQEMIKDFNNEDVTYDYNKFMKLSNLKSGGEMIRREDGSYSRRGLWDNIRENKGSGKKPTKEMLDQERKIKHMQVGGLWDTNRTQWVDSVNNANMNKNFVQRMYLKNGPSIQIPGEPGTSTHFMEESDGMVYPTVVQMPNGKLQYLNLNDINGAYNYAKKTRQFIKFPTVEQALWYGGKGYKTGTGVTIGKKQMGGEPYWGSNYNPYVWTDDQQLRDMYGDAPKEESELDYRELPTVNVTARHNYNTLPTAIVKGKLPAKKYDTLPTATVAGRPRFISHAASRDNTAAPFQLPNGKWVNGSNLGMTQKNLKKYMSSGIAEFPINELEMTVDALGFIPGPVGNYADVAGSLIDGYQAYDAFSNKDYKEGIVNTLSAAIPLIKDDDWRTVANIVATGYDLYKMFADREKRKLPINPKKQIGGQMSYMENGGGIPERYKNMGFTHVGQKKQGDAQHKWKVLAKKGDSYKVVQGGYRGMKDFSQHHDQDRKERFWDRMGGRNSSQAQDPFSPLYWHKRFGTWKYGGSLPTYQSKGQVNLGSIPYQETYMGRPVPSSNDIIKMGRAETQRLLEEKQQRINERKAAVTAIDNKGSFKLPTGETKTYDKMTGREKRYVEGKALEQRGRFFENEENSFDDYLNPLNLLGTMAGGLGRAPLEAKMSNSNLPYVSALATPLATGALGSLGSKNTRQFLNNTFNPIPFEHNFKFYYNLSKSNPSVNKSIGFSKDVLTNLITSENIIEKEGSKILNELRSNEGIKRLRNQFKLSNPDASELELDYLVNSRLDEVDASLKFNKPRYLKSLIKDAKNTFDPDDAKRYLDHFFPNKNAHWAPTSPYSDLYQFYGYNKPSRFNLLKSDQGKAMFENYHFEPGSITLGRGLENNVNVLDHEIGHAIQKGGRMPIDDELGKLFPHGDVNDFSFIDMMSGFGKDKSIISDKKYFDFAGGRSIINERYPFLREQRRKMLERGIINNIYDEITPYKLLKTRIAARNNKLPNYMEGDRLIKFTPFWKYGKLAKIMNTAPAVIPAAIAVGSMDEKKMGGNIPKYQSRGEVLPNTLLKKKIVGSYTTPLKDLNLQEIKNKSTEGWVYKPNCPEGVGCAEQAVDFAAQKLGLQRISFIPGNAAYRTAQMRNEGMIPIWDPYNGRSVDKNYVPFPAEKYKDLRIGDQVGLTTGGTDWIPYEPPAYLTEKDNNHVEHWGTVSGFTPEGIPYIHHGYGNKKNPNRGRWYDEPIDKKGKVRDLGHGTYRIGVVYRTPLVTDNGVQSVDRIVESGDELAQRKANTTGNAKFYLKTTPEDDLLNSDYPVAAQFANAKTRLQTKKDLVGLFQDKELDYELKYKLGLNQQEIDRMKPVIYGMAGQETNFNDPNFYRGLKETVAQLKRNPSLGMFQIKMNSLTDDEKRLLDINKKSDLKDTRKAYMAAMAILKNSKKVMDRKVEKGVHPGLQDPNIDPYFSSLYYYNTPMRAVNSTGEMRSKEAKISLNPVTWFNFLPGKQVTNGELFYNEDKNELRMDPGSYPYKVLQKAKKDLGLEYNNSGFDTAPELEAAIVYGSRNPKTKVVINEKKIGGQYSFKYNRYKK